MKYNTSIIHLIGGIVGFDFVGGQVRVNQEKNGGTSNKEEVVSH